MESLQPAISVVLEGARNAKQAIANTKAMNLVFPEDEIQFIHTELDRIK